MTTARRDTSNANISTYGDVSRDYTVLATWEAATDNDLVAANAGEVLECYDDAPSFDDGGVVLAGAVTDATYFRIVRPATGEGHDGTSNNGVYFSYTTPVDIFDLQEDYASIQDLLGTVTINHGSTRHLVAINASTGASAIACISFDGTNIGAGTIEGFIATGAADDCIFALCLAENNDGQGVVLQGGGGIDQYVYNCNAIDNAGNGFRSQGPGNKFLTNNIGDGNGGSDFSGFAAPNVFNCADSDGTVAGTDVRNNQIFTFVNALGNDYHLSDADVGARDFGLDLSADGFFAFDQDIDEDIFDTWDIGVDEPEPIPISAGAGNDPGILRWPFRRRYNAGRRL